MRNIDVANAFACGLEGEARNFFSTGVKAFSYRTVIAQHINGIIYLNDTYYSNTTSKHKNLIRRAFGSDQEIVILNNIPMGVDDLKPYLK